MPDFVEYNCDGLFKRESYHGAGGHLKKAEDIVLCTGVGVSVTASRYTKEGPKSQYILS